MTVSEQVRPSRSRTSTVNSYCERASLSRSTAPVTKSCPLVLSMSKVTSGDVTPLPPTMKNRRMSPLSSSAALSGRPTVALVPAFSPTERASGEHTGASLMSTICTSDMAEPVRPPASVAVTSSVYSAVVSWSSVAPAATES